MLLLTGTWGFAQAATPAQVPAEEAGTEKLSDAPALLMSGLFSDGAVLAADHPLAIWGLSSKGATVRVMLDSDSASTQVADDGRWRVVLPPHPASEPGQSHELRVEAQRGQQTITETRQNLVFGDLWLCAGQSNMERPISDTDGADQTAIHADDPLLRVLVVPERGLNHPARHLDSQWIIVDAAHVRDLPAIPIYFGLGLRQHVTSPIGLIVSTASGSRCEAWIEATQLRRQPQFTELFTDATAFIQSVRQRKAEKPSTSEPAEQVEQADIQDPNAELADEGITTVRLYRKRAPGVLYNGMIDPLRGLHLRGIAWYQGESNTRRPEQYSLLLTELLNNWRRTFDNNALPIAVVQLPKFDAGQEEGIDMWAQLREAQRTTCLAAEGVGLIVTLDLGDGTQRHPSLKQPVGQRLADWALSQVYGQPAAYPGPQPIEARRDGVLVRVRFEVNQSTLTTRDSQGPRMFELLDAQGAVSPVEATIDGPAVLLNVPPDFQPTAVRYAWSNNPTQANLCDTRGLPSTPFQLPVQDQH
ncbi:MAG: hypothetical protein IT445_18585 [Phycisphaeraceae bacterium]|nr:hypothetical protein [Phycisphaeraceae bacterium]